MAGLAAIFAAAVIPIIIMGVSLEVGKLVTAVWLHRHWSRATWWLKTYLSVAVFVLMFITSMGIFGFLSKAHIEQTSMSQEQVALIETIDDKIARSEGKIERWTTEMDRLLGGEDIRVDNLIDREQIELDKINALIKAVKTREIIISLIFIGAINRFVKFLLQISSKNNILKPILVLNKKSYRIAHERITPTAPL